MKTSILPGLQRGFPLFNLIFFPKNLDWTLPEQKQMEYYRLSCQGSAKRCGFCFIAI